MTGILVVEDDQDIRDSTAELLRARGYEVATLPGIEGFEAALRARGPDLILQDCHMPGLDLAVLIRSVRSDERFRSIPILLFTASIDAEEFWKRIGADGLVRKPFDVDELTQKIEECLGRTGERPTAASSNDLVALDG